MTKPQTKADTESWPKIIGAVGKTPLSFFVLALLIVNAAVGVLAIAGTDRFWLAVIALGAIIVIVCAVVILLVLHIPIVPSESDVGPTLGADVYEAISPYLSNLEAKERTEAYAFLILYLWENPETTAIAIRQGMCRSVFHRAVYVAQVDRRILIERINQGSPTAAAELEHR